MENKNWVTLFAFLPLIGSLLGNVLVGDTLGVPTIIVVGVSGLMCKYAADKGEYMGRMVIVLICTIVGGIIGTVYHYNCVSNDFATPIVGALFTAIQAGIALVCMIVGALLVGKEEKDRKNRAADR